MKTHFNTIIYYNNKNFKINIPTPISTDDSSWNKYIVRISDLKKSLKNQLGKVTFKVRGRGKRKSIFKFTNRYYDDIRPNGNDVYLSSNECKFMNYFTLYCYPTLPNITFLSQL